MILGSTWASPSASCFEKAKASASASCFQKLKASASGFDQSFGFVTLGFVPMSAICLPTLTHLLSPILTRSVLYCTLL